jgi:hypothetical protein
MRSSVLVAVLVLIPMSYADAQIPQVERDALIALYNSTDGANWSDNTNWLGAVGTECTWDGVNCAGGHVEELGLYNYQLSGVIPPELGNLSSLDRLRDRKFLSLDSRLTRCSGACWAPGWARTSRAVSWIGRNRQLVSSASAQ